MKLYVFGIHIINWNKNEIFGLAIEWIYNYTYIQISISDLNIKIIWWFQLIYTWYYFIKGTYTNIKNSDTLHWWYSLVMSSIYLVKTKCEYISIWITT